jgi:hypothetical protein
MASAAIIFGAGHGYQGTRFMILIAIYGTLFGALVSFPKVFAPGNDGERMARCVFRHRCLSLDEAWQDVRPGERQSRVSARGRYQDDHQFFA